MFLTSLLTAALTLASPTSTLFPYPVKTDRLKNGLTIIRVPFQSPGLLAYYSVVRVGSRNEVEKGHTGFAHYFEHVMFKGTAQFPEGAREKALGALGFDDNAFTTDDITVYHSLGPSSAMAKLIEIEADRFKNLAYSEATFQTEAKAVLGEYHKSATRPELKMEETLLQAAFSVHPYQHTTLGFYEDILKMADKYEYSKTFLKRWYTPDNTLLVIVGEFDDATLMQTIREHYESWQGAAPNIPIPTEPITTPPAPAKPLVVEWPTPTLPRLLYAWHAPSGSLTTLDAATQSVLVAYLVGPTSTLHRDLVLERQLCESIGSWQIDHRDPHLFSLSADLKDEKHRAEVELAFTKAVADIASGKIDAKRLSGIKQNLRYSIAMDLETPKEVAEHIAWYVGIYGSPHAMVKHFENIAKVSAANLVSFTRKYLTEKQRLSLQLKNQAASREAR